MNSVSVESMLAALDSAAVEYRYIGTKTLEVTSAKALTDFAERCIGFYRGDDPSVIEHLPLKQSVLLIKETVAEKLNQEGNLVITENPDLAFCVMAKQLEQKLPIKIHPSAIIDSHAEISEDVHIGANVVVGHDVQIGKGAVIEEGVVLKNCTIGSGAHLYPGVKVGSSGLGSHRDKDGKWYHFPHFGRVIIGRNVVIQDNCVIARGTLQDTVVEDSVAIGPLTWIAHGVHMQPNVLVASAVTIAGSVVVEEGAVIWGQAALRDGVRIGAHAIIGLGAVVVKDVPAGATVLGNPARTR